MRLSFLSNYAPSTVWALFILLLALPFGYELGLLYACRTQLSGLYMLENFSLEVVLCVFALGTLPGLFFGGWVSYGIGRKSSVLLGFALGAVACACAITAPSFSIELLSQFAAGLSCGIYLLSAILLNLELAEPRMRGTNGCSCAMGVLSGALLGLSAGDLMPYGALSGLIVLLCYSTLLFLLCLYKLPESPRWLALRGFSDAALAELLALRSRIGAGEAARELAGINERCRSGPRGVELFLQNVSFRRLIWFELALSVLMQGSGFIVLPYLSTELFSGELETGGIYTLSSFSSEQGLLKSCLMVQFFGALTAALLQLRWGSNRVLRGSAAFALIAFAMLMLGLFVSTLQGTNLLLIPGFLLLNYCAAIFICLFWFSVMAERMPLLGRELGLVTLLFFNFAAALCSFSYAPALVERLSLRVTLLVCLLLCVALCLLLLFYWKPQSSALSLEALEEGQV
ncbi:MAG: MFS transporter [Succinivibrio sp.]|nr:MFS transporter [Succinivibrio sp.]